MARERPRSDPECGRDSALRQHVVELTPVRLFGSAHYQKGAQGLCPYSSARTNFAASTRLRSDASTSTEPRVFKPQSGLTHNRSTGTALSASRRDSAISSTLGTRGEWDVVDTRADAEVEPDRTEIVEDLHV